MTTAMLVILACIHGSCTVHEIPVQSCALGGQADVLAWRATHPAHSVARWKCEPGRGA